MYKIEKLIHKGDYDYAKCPSHPNATKNGYVLYHRVVVENFIGRLLTKDEVVHHKDGNKHNNSIDNLDVLTSSEHAKLHCKTGRAMVSLTCPMCGKVFTRETRNLNPKTKRYFCSRSCNGKFYKTQRSVA